MHRKSSFNRTLSSPKRGRSGAARDVGDEQQTLEGGSPQAGSGSGGAAGTPVARSSSSRMRFSRRRQRRAASGPEELPELEQTDEAFQRDWGITRAREAELLVEFRTTVEARVGPLKPMFDKYYLRRFLRARQHDLAKATDMFLAHLKWRAANGVDTIQEDFNFTERDAFLTLYPQGYHKTDKLGRPVYIQHLGQINVRALMEITTEERMLKFHIQEYERCIKYIFPSCSKVAGRHINQTFAIMDVKGVGLKHLTGDVKRILNSITRTDQDNYPETLGKTVIINAPAVFKMIWAIVKPMLDSRTQAKIEVAPSDYMKLLQKWVDIDCIPEYLGGTSKGSLIDDVGPWKDPDIVAAVELDIEQRDRGAAGSRGAEEIVAEVSPAAQKVSPSTAEPAGAPSSSMDAPRQGSSPVPGMGARISSLVASDSELDEFTDARSRRASVISSAGSTYLSADEFSEVEGGWHSPTAAEASGRAGSFTGSERPLLDALGSPIASPMPRPASIPQGTAGPGPASKQYSDTYRSPVRGQVPVALAMPVATQISSSEGAQEISLNGGMSRQAGLGSPASVSGGKPASSAGVPSPPLQISILARVRALEERLPAVEKPIRRHLPVSELPSKSVGQGTLLSRVEALERAMDAVLTAQSVALEEQQRQRERTRDDGGPACCGCCSIM